MNDTESKNLIESLTTIALPILKVAQECIAKRDDSTFPPVWVIVKKRTKGQTRPTMILSGVFFSRQDAELEMRLRSYDYGGCEVYCFAEGSVACQDYRRAINEAIKFLKERQDAENAPVENDDASPALQYGGG